MTFDVSTMLEYLIPSRSTVTFDHDTDVLIPLESPIESSYLRTNVSFSNSSLVFSVPSSEGNPFLSLESSKAKNIPKFTYAEIFCFTIQVLKYICELSRITVVLLT